MDSDGSRLWIFILLYALVIMVKAFFAAAEYAVTEASDSKIRSLAEKDKKYKKLLELVSKPSDMLNAFSVNKILLNICASFIILAGAGEKLCNVLKGAFSAPEMLYRIISYLALFIVNAVLIIVLTEFMPKRFIHRKIDSFSVKCVPAVKFMIKFVAPIKAVSLGISFVLSKIFGLSDSDGKDTVTEEEILMMVEAGNETGVIEESQREMINNIFEFGDSVVSEVMTHRTDIVAVNVTDRLNDIVYLAINEGFSRIPVYENNIDTIIGVIYVKDLLCLIGCEHSEDFSIPDFMREAMYIPETNKCSDVFETMTLKKTQMAVVVDEYGGTAGIITIEDLLEEIVGNIQDEYDEEEQEFEKIDDNIYTVLGSADPEDIFPKLGLEIPDDFNYDTMSAFIVNLLGRIPSEDEMPSVIYENVEFTVLLVEDNWISKIKAVKLSGNDDDSSSKGVENE